MFPVFGTEHNHQYVFVNKVILRTDQKALVFIIQKPLPFQQYDYEISYKRNRGVLPAGYLSRAFMKGCEPTLAEQVVDRIHNDHFFSVPDHQLNETQRERFVTQLYRG